jgi:hypothetical protein
MLRLMLGVMAGEAARSASNAARRAVLLAIGGLFALIAAGFLTAAAFIALASHLSPLAAALILAGLFLQAALILLLVARAPARREAEATRARAEALAALSSVPDVVGRNPVGALAAAFAGGLILALRLRR